MKEMFIEKYVFKFDNKVIELLRPTPLHIEEFEKDADASDMAKTKKLLTLVGLPEKVFYSMTIAQITELINDLMEKKS